MYPRPLLCVPWLMAPPLLRVRSLLSWLTSPATTEVVPGPEMECVVVDLFKEAHNTGIPSDSSLRKFFRKFTCRTSSYSVTSVLWCAPMPSSEIASSVRRDPHSPEEVCSSPPTSGTPPHFVGVSIGSVSSGSGMWEAIGSPCHHHFDFQEVRSAATHIQLKKWTFVGVASKCLLENLTLT